MIEDLILKLKKEIIIELRLEDINPEDIDAGAPLFEKGLGLDSIDALEIVVLLEKNYGIKMRISKEEGRKILFSIRTMAEFILEHQNR